MNRARVDKACRGTFHLPGVIDIALKEKPSGVAVSQLESTAKNELKNKVCGRGLAFLFIDNYNRRIYSEIVKTLKNDYLMGQENYPMYMAITNNLLVNCKQMEKSSGDTSDRITFMTNVRPRTHREKSQINCF